MRTKTKQQLPKGWYMSGKSPELYEISLDSSHPHSGTTCARLRNSSKALKRSWATLMQDMGPQKYLNQRLSMSFWVKTENAQGWVQPWMRVDGPQKATVSFDNMCKRAIQGTTDWTQYSIVLDVPGDAVRIAFGVMLGGHGTLWFDDVSFEVVGKEIQITDCPCSVNYRGCKVATNLNFEEGPEG